MIRTGLNSAILASAITAVAGAAFAQEAAVEVPPQAAEGVSQIDDIIVTAQRRSELLRDVPISITALSAETLTKSGVTTTQDLARVTPGLELPYNGGYLQPAIRGVSSAGSDAGDSSNVALYLDGVYQASQPAQLMDLPDVEQVQVLKGPQGTLYGQNAQGGAIIITTRAPAFSPEGQLSASYGNYGDVALRGYVSGPLSDTVAASLALSYQDRDGFRRDLANGGRDAGLHSEVARGKLLFEPNDRFSILATAFWSDRSDSSLYSGVALNRNSTGYLIDPTAPYPSNPRETATDFAGKSTIEAYGASLRAGLALDAGVVSATTAYVATSVMQFADVDYSPVSLAEVVVDQRQHNFSQELNFVSEQFGRWSGSAGLFFLSGQDGFQPSAFTVRDPATGDALFVQAAFSTLEKEIRAAYAEVTYEATDRLILSLGGRYSYEHQKAYSNRGGPTPEEIESPFSPASFESFTPRATALYALTPLSNVYASYSQGFKSGLVSVTDFTNPPVRPEELTAYEVGYKGRLSDIVTMNLAVFRYDYENLQVARYNAPVYIYQNAASARIEGLDFDIGLDVTPDLRLSAAVSVLDGVYRSFKQAGVFAPNPGGGNTSVNIDVSGQRMVRAPEWTASLSADYTLETAWGRLGAFGALYHNDGYKFEPSGRIQQAAFTTLDGELSYAPPANDRWRVVLWGKNLTDRVVLQSVLQTDFADGVSYMAPRTFGVRLEGSF